MTDYFAVLDEPRRPWLEPDSLKEKFLGLSAPVHPDRVHGGSGVEKESAHRRYLELSAAYHCLREPKERLRHLLELELDKKPQEVDIVSGAAMDLFARANRACRDADRFLAECGEVTSPVLKVRLFERAHEWIEQLSAVREVLRREREELVALLRQMNAAWESAPAAGTDLRPKALPLERLEQVYRAWSHLGRWTGQIEERIVQLSL